MDRPAGLTAGCRTHDHCLFYLPSFSLSLSGPFQLHAVSAPVGIRRGHQRLGSLDMACPHYSEFCDLEKSGRSVVSSKARKIRIKTHVDNSCTQLKSFSARVVSRDYHRRRRFWGVFALFLAWRNHWNCHLFQQIVRTGEPSHSSQRTRRSHCRVHCCIVPPSALGVR